MENWTKVVLAFCVVLLFQLKGLLSYARRYWVARNIPHFGHVPFIGGIPWIPTDLAGAFHQIWHDKFPDYTQFLLDFGDKVYNQIGENVMAGWFFTDISVVPLDAEAVKVITNSSVELKKGRDYKFVERWLGPALLLGDGERWHRTRKLVTPGFHFQKLEEYVSVMDEQARVLVSILRKFDDGAEVNLFNYLKYCALDVIAETAMGVHLDAQHNNDNPYVQAVQKFNNLAVVYAQNPHYQMFDHFLWKYNGLEKQTVDALTTLQEMTCRVIQDRRTSADVDSNGEFATKADFLGLLLQNYREGTLPFEHLREEVDTFMFAGHDTSSHAIAWTVWCLACHQDVQRRLYDELEEAFSFSDADFATAKLRNLTYLDQVVKESMRIFPPVPIAEREIVNDVQMGKFTAPKGATVYISPLLLHRNSKFDPERFADGVAIPPEYIPFSAGPRNCIGQKFAIREVKITLAHLIHNFRVENSVPFHKNKPLSEVVLKPQLGVPVRLYKRF